MGLVVLNDIRSYWGSENGEHPKVYEAMTSMRFEAISRSLSLSDPDGKYANEFERVSY